jgi:hypothetical protein
VEGARNFSFSIHHQYRHTIGGKDSENDSWYFSHHSVADSTAAVIRQADLVDAIAVNLPQAGEAYPRVGGAPARQIRAYRAGIVAHAFGEIKRAVKSLARATLASHESMYELRQIPCAENRKRSRASRTGGCGDLGQHHFMNLCDSTIIYRVNLVFADFKV